mmetsp:Transcript_20791/g.36879  ORF Transcript_20791/g.36879 Transcript_20791/m.36879 type:complete len:99 (+) Transcript_20791:88-384(+)
MQKGITSRAHDMIYLICQTPGAIVKCLMQKGITIRAKDIMTFRALEPQYCFSLLSSIVFIRFICSFQWSATYDLKASKATSVTISRVGNDGWSNINHF